MKAAMVFDGLGVGGIERVGRNYAEMLIDLGYDVDIYNLKPGEREMEEEYPEECNIYHYSIPDIILPDHYLLIVKRWRWGKYLYPVIYFFSFVLMSTLKLRFIKHKKYDLAIAFSGHFRDLSFVAYDFIKSKKKLCWLHGSLIDYLLVSYTYGDLYRRIKNGVCLSESGNDAVYNSCRYLNGKLNIRKISNPIKTEWPEFDSSTVANLREKYGKYLLMVGRLDEDKDQATIIKARKILENKYGLTPKVVFVGDGTEKEKLKAIAKHEGLENEIIFVGKKNDVENYYLSAHIFVHSSKAEGMPMTLLESMKYGLPIVSTESLPGVREILGLDEYGLVCNVGDPHGMADCIFRMYKDNELYQSYREKGFDRVKEFSFETIEGYFAECIEDMI